jgi:hypothetical protein
MTDREPLELAAKAAGIEIAWHKWVIDPKATGGCCFALVGTYTYWNPLTDDGDALRLAVKLGLTITSNYHVEQKGLGVIVFTELEDSEDFCAATRRAIVRAAAEIGRRMK